MASFKPLVWIWSFVPLASVVGSCGRGRSLTLAVLIADAVISTASGRERPVFSSHAGAPDRITHLSASPYPEQVTGEGEYADWLESRSRRLLEAAGRDTTLQQRIELRLAAVNWMLARQCEPPMTRLLHRTVAPADGPFLAGLVQRALTEAAVARHDLKLLDELPDRDEDQSAQFADAIDTLECFGRALRIGAAGSADEARSVAAELSFYLEDDRPEVATAALVWQAVLFERSNRLDRALRSLPPAMKPMQPRTMEYDFFARLLRCRYLTDRGGFATAWTLTLLLEERSREWFPTQAQRNEAANAIVLAKLALCDAWVEALEGPAQERTQDWCGTHAARLREEYFSSRTDGALLRLATAAPIIVDIPESLPDPQTSEAAATTPSPPSEPVAAPEDGTPAPPDSSDEPESEVGPTPPENADEQPESHEAAPR